MKLISKKLGEVCYREDEVITFPEGLLGFPEKKRYVFVEHRGGSPLKWLQCLDDPSLSFVVVNPLLFKRDYEVRVDKRDLALVGDSDPAHITIWTLISFTPDAPEASTANLLGPLAINCATRLGKQLVLDPSKYDLRYPIFKNKR
ncbi:MAG: flagellar assembly protein FliW [Deltaproteobacteria bacterium]|nr:flagellar assembly protein FliW [Deltaproteobacteria bacterium]